MAAFRLSFANRTFEQAIAERVVFPLTSEHLRDLDPWTAERYREAQRELVAICKFAPEYYPFEVVLQISCLLHLDKVWQRNGGRYAREWRLDRRPKYVRAVRDLIAAHPEVDRFRLGRIIQDCLLALPQDYFVGKNPGHNGYLRNLYGRISRGAVPIGELGPWLKELSDAQEVSRT